jgi:hypothetical protein
MYRSYYFCGRTIKVSGGCKPSAEVNGYVQGFIDLALNWQDDSD